MDYLSIVAICKNEGKDIKEWIDYHLSRGVEHFYIYDNDSDNTRKVLRPYVEKGLITYREWRYRPPCQLSAYNDALKLYRDKSKWLAFIDIDEFLISDKLLPEVLKDYEEYGGLGANWLVYGSNGHIKRPSGGILENYTSHSDYGFDVNLHIKSIVNTQYVEEAVNPHFFTYKDGYHCVTENKEPVPQAWTKYYSGNVIRINHYYCKSKEDYERKTNRGS